MTADHDALEHGLTVLIARVATEPQRAEEQHSAARAVDAVHHAQDYPAAGDA